MIRRDASVFFDYKPASLLKPWRYWLRCKHRKWKQDKKNELERSWVVYQFQWKLLERDLLNLAWSLMVFRQHLAYAAAALAWWLTGDSAYPLFALPIAADTNTFADRVSSTSMTITMATTGSNRFLSLGLVMDDSDNISNYTATYPAGTSLTSRVTATGLGQCGLWNLVNPASGSNDCVITNNVNNGRSGHLSSYTGVSQNDGTPDATATKNGASSSTHNISITTVSNNCWVTAAMRLNQGTTETAEAGTTILSETNAGSYDYYEKGPVTPAGATTIGSTGATDAYRMVAMSFAPAAAAAAAVPLHNLLLMHVG